MFLNICIKIKSFLLNSMGFIRNITEILTTAIDGLSYSYGALENKNSVINIFLDISKAYDSADHAIRLSKLSN